MSPYAIILTHFISDWFLQPRTTAENKTGSLRWMSFHLSIIFLVFLFAGMVNCSNDITDYLNILWLCALNAITHFFIDSSLWGYFKGYVMSKDEDYIKYNRYAKDYWFYFTIGLDQILHLSIAFYLFGAK